MLLRSISVFRRGLPMVRGGYAAGQSMGDHTDSSQRRLMATSSVSTPAEIAAENIANVFHRLNGGMKRNFVASFATLRDMDFKPCKIHHFVNHESDEVLELNTKILSNVLVLKLLEAGMSLAELRELVDYRKADFEALLKNTNLEQFDTNKFNNFFKNQLSGDLERIATFIALVNSGMGMEYLGKLNHTQCTMLLAPQTRAYLDAGCDPSLLVTTNDGQHVFFNRLNFRLYEVYQRDAEDGEFVMPATHGAVVMSRTSLQNGHPHSLIKRILSDGSKEEKAALIVCAYPRFVGNPNDIQYILQLGDAIRTLNNGSGIER